MLSSALGSAGGPLELRSDYCYGVHVTGDHPDLRRVRPPTDACANGPQGLGLVKGLFNKGDTVELEVPIGAHRRIDLFGIPRSLIGGAVCDTTPFDVKPAEAGSNKTSIVMVNGAEFTGRMQLIANADANIVEGDNDITLMATGATPVGVPYGCGNGPKATLRDVLSVGVVPKRYVTQFPLGGYCSEADQTVTLVADAMSGATVLSSVTTNTVCASDNSWAVGFDVSTLPDGPVRFKSTISDSAGNVSSVASLTLPKDTTVRVLFDSVAWPTVPVEAGATIASLVKVKVVDATNTALPVGTNASPLPLAFASATDATCATSYTGYLYSNGTPGTNPGLLAMDLVEGLAQTPVVSARVAVPALYFQAGAQVDGTNYKSACVGPFQIKASSTGLNIVLSAPSGSLVAGVTSATMTLRDAYNNLAPVAVNDGFTLKRYPSSGGSCSSAPTDLGAAPLAIGASSGTVPLTYVDPSLSTYDIKAVLQSSGTVVSNCTSVMMTPAPGAKIVAVMGGQTLVPGTVNPVTGTPTASKTYVPIPQATFVQLDAFNNRATSSSNVLVSVTVLNAGEVVMPVTVSVGGWGNTYNSTSLPVRFREPGTPRLVMTSTFGSSQSSPITVTDVCLASPTGSFHAGAGITSDPYIICNESQLANVGLNAGNLSRVYELAADIDLTSEWTPIGSYPSAPCSASGSTPFTGSFNGVSHHLTGLHMDGTGYNCQGLFGAVMGAGTVKRLYVELSGDIVGDTANGGVVGFLTGTLSDTVVSIPSTATVRSMTNSAGGAVGQLGTSSLVQRVFVGGSTSGVPSVQGPSNIGGVVGMISHVSGVARITESGFDGYVSCNISGGNCPYVGGVGFGGLVGYSNVTSTGEISINRSFSRGKIVGSEKVGGLMGGFNVTTQSGVTASYAAMNIEAGLGDSYYVSGSRYFGGLIGYQGPSTTVTQTYSASILEDQTGSAYKVGQLFGYSNNNCLGAQCFFATDLSSLGNVPVNTGSVSNTVGTAATALTSFAAYNASWNFSQNLTGDYSTGGQWMMSEGVTRPALQWEPVAMLDYVDTSLAKVKFGTLAYGESANDLQTSVSSYHSKKVGTWYWEVKVLEIPAGKTLSASVGVGRVVSGTYPSRAHGVGNSAVNSESQGWGLMANGDKVHRLTTDPIGPPPSTPVSGLDYAPGDTLSFLLTLPVGGGAGSLKIAKNGGSVTTVWSALPRGGSCAGDVTQCIPYVINVGSAAATGTFRYELNAGTQPFRYEMPPGASPFNYLAP